MMNEHIKELVEQAANEYLVEQDPVTDTLSTSKRHELYQKAKEAGIAIIPNVFCEKFAELIIKEVLAVQERLIAEGHNAWHLNKPTREHFGVE